MKFKKLLKIKDGDVFKVKFADKTTETFKISNGFLYYLLDNEWVIDCNTTFNALCCAKDIKIKGGI